MSQLGLDISLHGQWIPCLNLTDFCELDAVIPASQGEVIWWDQVLVVVTQLFSHSVVSSSLWSQWTAARQASLSFTISQSLFKLMSIESAMPSNYLILCHPFLLLTSIFPSILVFSNESALCIRWPKYWSFSFTLSLSVAGRRIPSRAWNRALV